MNTEFILKNKLRVSKYIRICNFPNSFKSSLYNFFSVSKFDQTRLRNTTKNSISAEVSGESLKLSYSKKKKSNIKQM